MLCAAVVFCCCHNLWDASTLAVTAGIPRCATYATSAGSRAFAMPRQSIMVGEHQVGLAGVLHMLVLGTHPPVCVCTRCSPRHVCSRLLNTSIISSVVSRRRGWGWRWELVPAEGADRADGAWPGCLMCLVYHAYCCCCSTGTRTYKRERRVKLAHMYLIRGSVGA